MRLLVLAADYCGRSTWSGIGVAAMHQSEALANLGCEVHVISPALTDHSRNARNLCFHRLTRDRFPLTPRPADIVHLHSLSLGALALEIKRRFGSRLIYTAHAMPVLELPNTAVGREWSAVQDQLFSSADHVVFLNEAERRAAQSRVPGICGRSSQLPGGIPLRGRMSHRRSGRLALFAGRFARSKGVDIATAAVSGLLERGSAWQFVFAGGHGDPEERALIDSLTRRYPQNCRLTGWLDRDSLESLYSQASLVLMPSRYEPFGMVALEAMSFGVPVLGSNALHELIQPESGGRIVEGNWIAACESLMEDAEAREAMSARGPTYVAARYDSVTLARRFLAQVAA